MVYENAGVEEEVANADGMSHEIEEEYVEDVDALFDGLDSTMD